MNDRALAAAAARRRPWVSTHSDMLASARGAHRIAAAASWSAASFWVRSASAAALAATPASWAIVSQAVRRESAFPMMRGTGRIAVRLALAASMSSW